MILGPRTRRAAVIDLGSNTANLAVYTSDDAGGLECVAEHDEPLRLLGALDASGALPEPAVTELLHVLHEFLGEATVLEADTVDVLATSALRDAANRDAVVARVEAELGLRVQVLDGQAEGRCAAQAVLRALPVDDAVVVDMGGGSLQLVAVRARRIAASVSLPLGALRLALRHPFGDPPDHAALTAMRREVVRQLAGVSWLSGAGAVIGVGGTLRALGRIDRRARQWAIPHGHGYRLSVDAAEAIWDLVSRVPESARQQVPGLPGHRVDLIVPGAMVATWLLRLTGADAMGLCDDGVREGWLLGATPPGSAAEVREAGLLARFPATVEEGTRAGSAREAALALHEALGGAPARREVLAAAAWTGALWAGRPPGSGTLAALFAEPIAGWWQDEVLAVADLLSPVPRLQLPAEEREQMRVILDVVAARPEGPVHVGLEGVRLAVRGRVHVDLLNRFERAFGRALRVEQRKPLRVREAVGS